MNKSRLALLSTAGALAAGLTLWLTTGTAPASDTLSGTAPVAVASPGEPITAHDVYAQLEELAGQQGLSVSPEHYTYIYARGNIVAHIPLDATMSYSEDDFAAGVPVMAVFIQRPGDHAVPNGAYLVNAQRDPGADEGTATWLDGAGNEHNNSRIVVGNRDEVDHCDPGPAGHDPVAIPVISWTRFEDGRLVSYCEDRYGRVLRFPT